LVFSKDSAIYLVGHMSVARKFSQYFSHAPFLFTILLYTLSIKITFLFTKTREIVATKVVIDLPFVSSYNTNMKIKFAGFFRPDHDPPQNELHVSAALELFNS